METQHYVEWATRFSLEDHPVVVTDFTLNAVYFNPAATASEVILMTSDFVYRCLPGVACQHILTCRRTHQPKRFFAMVGTTFQSGHLIEVERDEFGMILHLYHQPEEEELPVLGQMKTKNYEQDHILNTAAHLLLSTAEILATGAALQSKAMSEMYRKQALQVIKANRETEYYLNDIPCNAVDAPALLHLICRQMAPFVLKKFGKKIFCAAPATGAAIKCNVPIFRNIIYSLSAILLQINAESVYIQYSENDTQVLISLCNDSAARSDTDSPYSVFNDGIGKLNAIDHAIRRHQGKIQLQHLTDGRVLFLISLVKINAEVPIREHLPELLKEDISSLEIEFSNLL